MRLNAFASSANLPAPQICQLRKPYTHSNTTTLRDRTLDQAWSTMHDLVRHCRLGVWL